MGHMSPGISLMPELLPSTPVLVPGSPTGIAVGNGNSTQKHFRTDKLEVPLLLWAQSCLTCSGLFNIRESLCSGYLKEIAI